MNTVQMLLWLVVGCVGMGYFMYGRRKKSLSHRYVGIALMVYPYFVSNTLVLLVIGLVLVFLPKHINV